MADLAEVALRYVGIVPYDLGAPVEAMTYRTSLLRADCSSFVQYCASIAEPGLTLPRTADRQYQATERFRIANPSPANLRRNDLLFFGGWDNPSNPPGYAGIQHVAISLGGDALVQEGGSVDNVNTADTVRAYGRHFLYATRPLGDAMAFTPTGDPTGVARVGTDKAIRGIRLNGALLELPLGKDVPVYGEDAIPGYATDGTTTSAAYSLGKDADGATVYLLKRNATAFVAVNDPAIVAAAVDAATKPLNDKIATAKTANEAVAAALA